MPSYEKGRWRSIPREDRLCKQCNKATIETISHFMLICPKTNTIRKRFYDNVTTIIHDVNLNVTDDKKITRLLSDHRRIKITANFIIKCMEGGI